MSSVLVSPGADHQLARLLEERGARVRCWPALAIAEPSDNSSLSQAVDNLFGYDWLILKNARAANYFLRSLLRTHAANELGDLRVVTIGPDAAEAFAETHAHVDIALDRFAHRRMFSEIAAYVNGGAPLARLNVFVPSAGITRELFEEELENTGARVDSVKAYQTCNEKEQPARMKTLLLGGGIDCVAFTQSAEIDELATLFDTDDLPRLFAGVAVLCLDRATNDTAIEFGLSRTMTPAEPSISGLADLIAHTGA
jgi:uroporphyrinogen-III synthase